MLGALIVVPFVITPVFWSLWEPRLWIKLLVTLGVVGPVCVLIGGVRDRTARALESADEAAERTGRRRPVSAGVDADHRATFTWNSRMGRRLIMIGVFWSSATVFGIVLTVQLWRDDPPRTAWDAATAAVFVFLMVFGSASMAVLNFGGLLRQIRRTSADPAERAFVTVVGVDPGTGRWVLERLDNGLQLSALVLGGSHLLVAGDDLFAEGTLHKPPNSWRRPMPAMFALTGPFGTLWAQHGDLPVDDS